MKQTELKEKSGDKILQLVGFRVGKEEFAVDILQVQEINKMIGITKMPNSPAFVEGVVNLRGRIIPVIDLRTRLRMDKKEHDSKTRIIVVEISGKTLGFIVDEVSEVLRIPESITELPPDMVTNIETEFIKAVAKLEDRLIILIDLEKIIKEDEIKQVN
ncbi:MAG: purine-binding chemotaxis protein CheW [Ignavibacteria bacterium]|nr:purine-binding chemotaxis protein CheW [Ignavibacteria bacterium]